MPTPGTGASVSQAQAVLRLLYDSDKVNNSLYEDSPLLGMMPKVDDFGGFSMFVVVKDENAQGVSPDFPTANASYTANDYQRFTLTRAKLYGVGRITGELLRVGKKDKDTLINTLKDQQDGLLYTMKKHLTSAMFGNGGGAIGQIAAVGPGAGVSVNGQAAPTLTDHQIQLVDPGSSYYFARGATHVVSATDGTTGSVRSGTSVVVTGVSRTTGVVTYDTAIAAGGTTFASVQAGDFVFLKGGFGAGPKGLAAWVPSTDPAAGENFLGVDRSPDATRLAGVRYDGTQGTIEEAFQYVQAVLMSQGASPDTAVVNPMDLARVLVGLQSRTLGTMASTPTKGTIGYTGVKIAGVNGVINLFADPSCPAGRAYVLKLNTWKLHYAGPGFPGYLDNDGLTLRADPNDDAYLWRMGTYYNIACNNPGQNATIALPS